MWRLTVPLLAVIATSCATMTSGTHETIAVTSSPSGATANLQCDRHSATETTPAKIVIRRNAGDCLLTVSKESYEPAVFKIEQGVNPMYWANMLFSPLAPAGAYLTVLGDGTERTIGLGALVAGTLVFGTDFYTGAVHVHRPGVVDVVLKPKEQKE